MADYRRCPACDVSWFGDDKECWSCGSLAFVGYIHIEVSLSRAHEKCWAERRVEWGEGVAECNEKAVTHLGLCEDHHAEIVPLESLVSA